MTDPANTAPAPGPRLPQTQGADGALFAALGPQFIVQFLLTFGGAILDMGNRPKGGGRLAALVGHERAAALAEHAHKLQRRVPNHGWQPCCTGKAAPSPTLPAPCGSATSCQKIAESGGAMTADARYPAPITALLTEAHHTAVLLAAAMVQNYRLVTALKPTLQTRSKPALKPL